MDQSPATAAQRLALKEWTCILGKKWTLFLAVTIGDTETVENLLDEGVPIDTKYFEGMSLLHWAAGFGNVSTTRLLISRGCSVDSADSRGLTPLHLAAAMGQTKSVKELIRNGASMSVVANTFGLPFHQAVFEGRVETVVAMMIEGCPVDAVDTTTGFTVLHAAAQGGCVAMVRILYRRCNLNAIDSVGRTPLHIAAASGQTEFATELMKLGANTSVVAGMYATPLHHAACAGHLETVVAMLEEGCPLDAVDTIGSTVLCAAAEGGHADIVRELVHRGCDVNAVAASGSTPLHHAASCGRTEVVCELIKLGATKSVVASTFGTPLHQAAIGGHVETTVAMLEEGCPLTTVANNGSTALHWAAEGGHVEVMRELISRGCDVNAVDANGCTPLHSAVTFGRTEAVRELITLSATKSVYSGVNENPCCLATLHGHKGAGADLLEKRPANGAPQSIVWTDTLSSPLATDYVNSANNNGLTPLMWAFGGGHVGVCSLLVGNGALITAKDKYGWLVFEHCFVGGHARKLSQFCEACGIRSCGERLRDALATLITLGLVDAHKVLCLCAISGDSLFLDSDFTDLITSDCSPLPMIVKYAKAVFTKEVTVIDELNLPDDSALNPLHISLLSLKLYEMGHIPYLSTPDAKGSNDHTLFITKLLSHPVLKETVSENFQNGLSPLDLAQQFELHDIAALIERAGGHPGVWADIPQEIEARRPLDLLRLKEAYASIKAIADDSEHGHEFIKGVFSRILGGQTVESVVHVADDSRLVKERVLGLCPDLGDIVKHVLPRIQARHWKKFGLALGMKKSTLDEFGEQFSKDDDRYLETLSYWLEHVSSVTWKSLLDILGHFETKHTVDELTDKIVSVLGGGHQEVTVSVPFRPVMCSVPGVGGGTVAAEKSPPSCEAKQVLNLFRNQFIADMDANAVVWELLHRGIISRGAQERIAKTDEPKQRNEILHDCLQRTITKEALMEVCDIIVAAKGHPKMQNVGEDMKCRLHTATPVQVVQKHAEEFLERMNCKVIAPKLKTLKLIPESVECDILQSKSKEEANVYLLNHLKEEADEDTVREVFRIASEKAGYGKMNKFASGVLRELQ